MFAETPSPSDARNEFCAKLGWNIRGDAVVVKCDADGGETDILATDMQTIEQTAMADHTRRRAFFRGYFNDDSDTQTCTDSSQNR